MNLSCGHLFFLQVVFRDGEGALQVLPRLLDVLPEARLNLIIYYLKQNDLEEAYKLSQDLDPSVPQASFVSVSRGDCGHVERFSSSR